MDIQTQRVTFGNFKSIRSTGELIFRLLLLVGVNHYAQVKHIQSAKSMEKRGLPGFSLCPFKGGMRKWIKMNNKVTRLILKPTD